jgi:hypothetical protein
MVFTILSWTIRGAGVAELAVYWAIFLSIRAVVYLCVDAMLQAALVYLAIEDLTGSRPSARDCIRGATTRLFPAIGIYFVVNEPFRIVSVVIGRLISVPTSIAFPFNIGVYGVCLVLAYVPGVVLLVRWFVAAPVLIHERSGVLRSLARGRNLTKGNRWLLLGLWLIIFIAEIGIGLAVARAFAIGTIPRLLLDALTAVADSVILPIVMATSYIELRQVKEGAGADELKEIFA